MSVGSAADWTPPTVVVDDPGQWGLGTVTVTATASDDTSGLVSVTITCGCPPAAAAGRPSAPTPTPRGRVRRTPPPCPTAPTTCVRSPSTPRATARSRRSSPPPSPTPRRWCSTPSPRRPASVPTLGRRPCTGPAAQRPALRVRRRRHRRLVRPLPGEPRTGGDLHPRPRLSTGTWDVRVAATVGGTPTLTDEPGGGVVVDLTDPTVALTAPAGPVVGHPAPSPRPLPTSAPAWSRSPSSHRLARHDRVARAAAPTPRRLLLRARHHHPGRRQLGAACRRHRRGRPQRRDRAGHPDRRQRRPHPDPDRAAWAFERHGQPSSTATDPQGVVSVTFEYRAVGATTWSTCGTTACRRMPVRWRPAGWPTAATSSARGAPTRWATPATRRR